ncbi:MAG: uracil phosphoribosyltransferase [Planctomycetaceae bacterium]|nr:uracil phosphoribosyltransferase [Planctomycetaceae bacterium]
MPAGSRPCPGGPLFEGTPSRGVDRTIAGEHVVRPLFVSTHPVVHHMLGALRDVRTGPPEFRHLVRRLAVLIATEATADLPTRDVTVQSPLGPAPARVLTDKVGIVPVLRAGLGMAEGILELIPDAEVWHIGLFRDEATLRPMEYYNKFPARPRIKVALMVDPMLATGGSAVRTCEILKSAGVPRLKLLSLIAAPEGIARVHQAMPDVAIYVGTVDERLNEVGFIYPGLGDAGDRQFATGLEPS